MNLPIESHVGGFNFTNRTSASPFATHRDCPLIADAPHPVTVCNAIPYLSAIFSDNNGVFRLN